MSADKKPPAPGPDSHAARRMPVAVAFADDKRTNRPEEVTPGSTSVAARQARAPRAGKASRVTVTEDVFAEGAAVDAAVTPSVARRFPFGTVFLAALSALMSLWFGATIFGFIESLFATRAELGWLALGLAALAALALAGFLGREIIGVIRLEGNADLSRRIAEAHSKRDVASARKATDDVVRLCVRLPATAASRTRLGLMEAQFLSAQDLVEITERELMGPLDAAARTRVIDAAKRVSVVTAVSPRAFVDIGFVLFENARLIRAVAEIYGCRPGVLGFLRLARAAIAHLAVTGVVAMGDSFVQQIVGHGLAARVSARLGEGVLNGVMTARIGFAAMEVTRPMPAIALQRPNVAAVLAELSPLGRGTDIDKR